MIASPDLGYEGKGGRVIDLTNRVCTICTSAEVLVVGVQELNLTLLVSSLYMQITTCLLVLFNQSGAESFQLVSSISAYEHLYFDLELFESDLPLQFLSYLVKMDQLESPFESMSPLVNLYLSMGLPQSTWVKLGQSMNIQCLPL